jgi:hypothetical protein
MATYTIIPHSGGHSFDVALIADNGARQTLLGFATEADATAWIESDRSSSSAGVDAPVTFLPAARYTI